MSTYWGHLKPNERGASLGICSSSIRKILDERRLVVPGQAQIFLLDCGEMHLLTGSSGGDG